MVGNMTSDVSPVVLNDQHGEVHFHLVPYCDPSVVAHEFQDESVKTHNQAMEKITQNITHQSDKQARHVFIVHAFVTPDGEAEENTSESEKPLSIGGSEYRSEERRVGRKQRGWKMDVRCRLYHEKE